MAQGDQCPGESKNRGQFRRVVEDAYCSLSGRHTHFLEFVMLAMQRLDRSLADDEIRQAVEFGVSEMLRLGAQKAIVGNFAYLDGERCLGLSCVERRFEQSAQSADSYTAICHPAPKQGRNDRTDENYGDRGRVEPGFQHGVATPCRQERPHFAQIYGEDELCRSPAKACRNLPIWPCAASILDFGTPLAEHFP